MPLEDVITFFKEWAAWLTTGGLAGLAMLNKQVRAFLSSQFARKKQDLDLQEQALDIDTKTLSHNEKLINFYNDRLDQIIRINKELEADFSLQVNRLRGQVARREELIKKYELEIDHHLKTQRKQAQKIQELTNQLQDCMG